ncbi:hypothetical protein THAOC_27255, partial [Thalassiosira oceanica]
RNETWPDRIYEEQKVGNGDGRIENECDDGMLNRAKKTTLTTPTSLSMCVIGPREQAATRQAHGRSPNRKPNHRPEKSDGRSKLQAGRQPRFHAGGETP